MNQTKKRLAIIKLAISMTDTETIQLQVLKLGMLKTDSRMREILKLLNENSYARAQELISAYIEAPSDKTVLQRTSQEEKETPPLSPEEAMIEHKEEVKPPVEKASSLQEKIQSAKDQAIIDEFDLFIEDPETEPKETALDDVNYDALIDIAPPPKKMSTESVNYDSLLNVGAEDVLSDNIDLDISAPPKDDFFKKEIEDEVTPKKPEEDTFFDIKDHLDTDDLDINDMVAHEKLAQDNFFKEPVEDKVSQDTTVEYKIPNNDKVDSHEPSKAPETIVEPKPSKSSTDYQPISYIDQKFKNMYNQYPPVEDTKDSFDTVDAWLIKISNDGYSEQEVEEMITYIEKLSESNKAEAAQLLLISAATESKYAQFRLARALYRGEILQKNLAESFTLINRLAMNDSYPEAICDLAQFYENGIGITKDKKKAEALYKEAMELGINRAIEHYEKIRKENKGFFGAFKR